MGLLQLKDKAALSGAPRSIWNMLEGPASGFCLAIRAEGQQPHLAHIGTGGSVLDAQAWGGLLRILRQAGTLTTVITSAVD